MHLLPIGKILADQPHIKLQDFIFVPSEPEVDEFLRETEPHSYNIPLFKIPPDNLLPIHHSISMMETDRSLRTAPILSNQIGPMSNPITINKILLLNNRLVTQSNHNVPRYRSINPDMDLVFVEGEGF